MYDNLLAVIENYIVHVQNVVSTFSLLLSTLISFGRNYA